MFDIGFLELLLVFIVGLLVIGPEKLPGTIKTVALWIGRVRRMFTDVQQDIQRELQIEELKRSLEEAKSQTIVPPEITAASTQPTNNLAAQQDDTSVGQAESSSQPVKEQSLEKGPSVQGDHLPSEPVKQNQAKHGESTDGNTLPK